MVRPAGIPGLSTRALEVVSVSGGSRVRLKAAPGARRNAILGVHAGALKVSIVAIAEKGRANRAIERLLAEALSLSASSVSIVAGGASREKWATIAGLAPEEV